MHEGVWKALSDPTRRAILDQLRDGPKSTGDLCACFPPLDRCTVMKHLDALVQVNLVLVHRQGKVRWNTLNPAPLVEVVLRWVSPYAIGVTQRAMAFRQFAEATQTEQSAKENES